MRPPGVTYAEIHWYSIVMKTILRYIGLVPIVFVLTVAMHLLVFEVLCAVLPKNVDADIHTGTIVLFLMAFSSVMVTVPVCMVILRQKKIPVAT